MPLKRRFTHTLFACMLTGALLASAAGQSAQPSAQPPRAADARTIYVTVFTEHGEYIRNLRPEAFAVSVGGRDAPIASFADADVPTTIGILFDASGSMLPRLGSDSRRKVMTAIQSLFWSAKNTDEFFLVAFNDKPQLLLRNTTDTGALTAAFDRLTAAKSFGQTALYDAMYLAINHASNSRHAKRVLVVFTDGIDNKSTFKFEDVKRALREGDVIVYMVSVPPVNDGSWEVVGELTALSGGRAYFPSTDRELEESMRRIASELRSQYALGVAPAPAPRKDNWHGVKVKLSARGRDEKGKAVKLYTRTREGVYWPARGN